MLCPKMIYVLINKLLVNDCRLILSCRYSSCLENYVKYLLCHGQD